MPSIVPVGIDTLPSIHRGLLEPLNPRIPVDHWRRVLAPPWEPPDRPMAYALVQDGRYVGFASHLHAPHGIVPGSPRVCNFGSWVVDAPYRSSALALAMPLLQDLGLVVTALTNVPSVQDVLTRLGFQVLDTHVRLHWWAPIPFGGWDVQFDDAIDIEALPASAAPVHRAHRSLGGTALVRGRHGTCYVIYTVIRRRGVRGVRLHHVDSRDGLSWALRPLQAAVLRRHGAFIVEYDRRLGVGAPHPYVDVPLSTPRLFRGGDVSADQVTNAYSETVLLNI